jgi:hypothetical protein
MCAEESRDTEELGVNPLPLAAAVKAGLPAGTGLLKAFRVIVLFGEVAGTEAT